jgi:DNA repair exonuclease SbcCD ATPase subunit
MSENIEVSESSDVLRAEIDKLTDTLTKIRSNKQYESLQKQVNEDKFSYEHQLAFLKDAVKLTGANGIQTDAMKEPFVKIEKFMNDELNSIVSYGEKYTDKSVKFMSIGSHYKRLGKVRFNIEAKANSFDFGFKSYDRFVPFAYLSSGERTMFSVLFLIALSYISNVDLKTVLIDDMLDNLDYDSFNAIMNALDCKDVQLICAGVHRIDDFTDNSTKLYVVNV